MRAALSDLERVKRHAGCGNLQASINGYERVYQRIERLARALFELTGQETEVPSYDPPKPLGAGNTVKIGAPDPLAAPEAPARKKSKTIPADIKPGTRRWYAIQGVPASEGCPE